MWNVSDHLAPFFCMAVIIIGAQAIRHHLQYSRLRGDANRLRGALAISLQGLRKLYEDNLVVLAGDRPLVISGRNQIGLLRQQLTRLTCLREDEIEAVLLANIAAEEVETGMAISGRRIRGVAYTVPEASLARGKLESTITQACSKIESAERLLTPSAARRAVEPSEEATVIEFASHVLRNKRRPLATTLERGSTSTP